MQAGPLHGLVNMMIKKDSIWSVTVIRQIVRLFQFLCKFYNRSIFNESHLPIKARYKQLRGQIKPNPKIYFLLSAQRLSNVHAEIGLSEDNMTEIAYHNDSVGQNITFTLNTTLCARYVRIWLEKSREYLMICELEVYGTECKL